ncbi:MAG: AAA family ATPase [Candidatus Asgardarchaeia archaeon]
MLLKSLMLKNFRTHRETLINFDNVPILLITGANGSGKTLVLDALLIAFGGLSKRAKQMSLSSFIGPFDKNAKIILTLNNPKAGSRRILHTDDPSLDRLLDSDIIKIEVTITKNNLRSYRINGRKTIDGVPINSAHIRRIFRSVNINPDNPLFVTEQGTINSFESLTPHKQFEILLESSDLKIYLDKLKRAQTELEREERTVKPLLIRLKEEERKLQVLKKAYEDFKRRNKIEKEIKRLEIELVWSEVEELKKKREKLFEQYNQKDQEISEISSMRNKIEMELSKVLRDLQNLKTEADNINRRISEFERSKRILEDELELLKSSPTMKNKNLEQSFYDKLAILEKEINEISDRINQITQEIELIDSKKDELDEIASSAEGILTNYERVRLEDVSKFLNKLNELGVTERVRGPLFSYIHVKEPFLAYSNAIKLAFRRNMFTFIAMDAEAFKIAKRIFDELNQPEVTVIRYDLITSKRRMPIQDNAIIDWASNLIDGDPVFVKFLKSIDNTLISRNDIDPNRLAEIAKRYNATVITQNCKGFFIKFGGFTKPPRVPNIDFGTPLGLINIGSANLYQEKKQLEEKKRKLMEEKISLRTKLHELRLQYQRLSKLVQKQAFDKHALKSDVFSLREELESIIEQINSLNAKKAELDNLRKSLEEKQNLINQQIGEFQQKIKDLEKEKQQLSKQLEELDKLYEEKVKAAKEKGIRPNKVRPFDEIRDNLIKLRGMLDAIKVTIADKERFEEQQKVVRDLKEYIAKRNEHICNLRSDLRMRIEEWRRILLETVSKIEVLMNVLLRSRFNDIKLKLANIENPDKTELLVSVKVEKDGEYRSLYALSGGERVLIAQSFILSLHVLTNAPVQIIDELTQRLDESYQVLAFDVVSKAQKLMSSTNKNGLVAQFILLAPALHKSNFPDYVKHIVFLKVRSGDKRWETVTAS